MKATTKYRRTLSLWRCLLIFGLIAVFAAVSTRIYPTYCQVTFLTAAFSIGSILGLLNLNSRFLWSIAIWFPVSFCVSFMIQVLALNETAFARNQNIDSMCYFYATTIFAGGRLAVVNCYLDFFQSAIATFILFKLSFAGLIVGMYVRGVPLLP